MIETSKLLGEKPKRLPSFEEISQNVVSLLDRNTFDELHADQIENLIQRKLTEVYHASKEHGSNTPTETNVSLLEAEYRLKGIVDMLEILGDQKAARVLQKTTEDAIWAGFDVFFRGSGS